MSGWNSNFSCCDLGVKGFESTVLKKNHAEPTRLNKERSSLSAAPKLNADSGHNIVAESSSDFMWMQQIFYRKKDEMKYVEAQAANVSVYQTF